jgi:hypothetical protein
MSSYYKKHEVLNRPACIHPPAGPLPARRVVFLDFDGVIITPRSHLALGTRGGLMVDPDPVVLAILRKVCDTGVRIVVSSTWRLTEARCRSFLSRHELIGYLHADWRTPDTSRDAGGIYISKGRGDEIAAWLAKHAEVQSYRILDDDTDMQPAQMPYFIRCAGTDGLDYKGVRNLLTWAGLIGEPKEAA